MLITTKGAVHTDGSILENPEKFFYVLNEKSLVYRRHIHRMRENRRKNDGRKVTSKGRRYYDIVEPYTVAGLVGRRLVTRKRRKGE